MRKRKEVFRLFRVSLQVKVVLFVAFVFLVFAVPFIRYNAVQQQKEREDLIARNLSVYLDAFRKNVEGYASDKWGQVSTEGTSDVALSTTFSRDIDEKGLNSFLENIFGTDKKQKQLQRQIEVLRTAIKEQSRQQKLQREKEQKLLVQRQYMSIQEYLFTLTNIPSFSMAFFVDPNGYIVFHTKPELVGGKISQTNREILFKGYLPRLYFVRLQRSYEAFIPLYDQSFSQGIVSKEWQGFLRDVSEGKLFRSQSLPAEVRRNFLLIERFDEVYDRYFDVSGNLTLAGEKLKSKGLMTSSLVRAVYTLKQVFDRYKRGQEQVLVSNQMTNLVRWFQVAGVSEKEILQYQKWYRSRKIFTHTNLLKERDRQTLVFLDSVERYLRKYIEFSPKTKKSLWRTTDLLDELLKGYVSNRVAQDKVSKKKFTEEGYTAVFEKSYFVVAMQNAAESYLKLRSYRTRQREFDSSAIHELFQYLYAPYRTGTVAILLSIEDFERQQKAVELRSIDMAVFLLLRVLLLAWIFVRFMLQSLAKLAEGTEEIASGKWGKQVEVFSYDEIGDLAERFNAMSLRIAKMFQEVKEKSRMEAELESAKEIQNAILPQQYPQVSGYLFSVYYQPQTESGGDYYDFVEVGANRLGVVVADVTGHGVGAGMVMAMLRSALRTYAGGKLDAARVLKEVNPVLYRDTLPTMFATVFYGVLDIQNHELYYTSAGHQQGILYHPQERKIRLLKGGGMPVGMVESSIFDPEIQLYKVGLRQGEFLILYTDGITEAKNQKNEEYGETRFYEAISRFASTDVHGMRDKVISDLLAFCGDAPPTDDRTMLIVYRA
ncbi:SpoIIE family protein phosphatase [Thermospira aquatica]|uniref:SpoIIE family protein phosphatase n=1 Tax=Thermospira aquatica TaxID=2828656 RepID=A0AAX3BAR0_9SPIR|nr:SpoIIE family protein phosphatase [Thermospira aquatica]URA09362.1 SpoIIE family protein phosphatase [Thermospira aquatica]